MTQRDELIDMGLCRFARVFMAGDDKNAFTVAIENQAVARLGRTVYAFVIDTQIVRIGSSKAPLRRRMRSWELSVTGRLRGRSTSTPDWEARCWRERLLAAGEGEIYARQGHMVLTPIGTFPAFLDEESLLIQRCCPPLNRNQFR